ncbi:MAG: hypothetical protein QNL12_06510 [Acidimicrobiia bacterium]|nr:hypothetical protein [Acidimicrobiia bacterium]MDX2466946.1 hypothetical protein [Acidimicrobiia bacterium]
MNENSEYRDALKMGFRRAGMHWLRASYEVVAGVGALLDEVARSRQEDSAEEPDEDGDGPVRIELD